MIKFDCLNAILEMDFTELRSKRGKATDRGLRLFITNINGYFAQMNEANRPTDAEVQHFNELMERILAAINTVEYHYHLTKFRKDYADFDAEMIEAMTRQTEIKSPKNLPTRMQYWAATEEFGGCIRNPEEHRQAVKYLEAWYGDRSAAPGAFFTSPRRRADRFSAEAISSPCSALD